MAAYVSEPTVFEQRLNQYVAARAQLRNLAFTSYIEGDLETAHDVLVLLGGEANQQLISQIAHEIDQRSAKK